MSRQQQQQQQQTLPTFVKQLLFLVMPKQSQQTKSNNTEKTSNSPFAQLYFSFPALEEDTMDSTCGQHRTRYHQHEESNNVKANNVIC